MLILKYRNIGETNSSSTHALVINGKNMKFPVELNMKVNLNDLYTTEFGWGREVYSEKEIIAHYMYLQSKSLGIDDLFCEFMRKRYNIEIESCELIDEEDIGYIDHQSLIRWKFSNLFREDFASFLADVTAYVLSIDDIMLIISNDNEPDYTIDYFICIGYVDTLWFLRIVRSIKKEDDIYHIVLNDGSYIQLKINNLPDILREVTNGKKN